MAIGTIPDWIRGPNTLQALSSGASAGSAVARTEQEGVSESARLGMEAQRMRQSAAIEQARLQQADEHAQMEFQARQKLSEQNQLREQQRLNIENAYKTAALGIAKGRLEQTQSAAEEKAKAAALTFRDEQGFAQHLGQGGSVLEGLQKFPRVGASYLNAVTHATQDDNKGIHVGDAIVERQPDGSYKEKYRAPSSSKPIKVGNTLLKIDPETGQPTMLYGPKSGMSETDKEDLKDLRTQRKDLSSKISAYLTPPDQKQALTGQLSELDKRIEAIKHPVKFPESSSTAKDKLVRAHALGIAHPDWTKEQIIDAVNKEMP